MNNADRIPFAEFKGGQMLDPIAGAGLAKAAVDAIGSGSNTVAPGLIKRILGPSADEIGEALRRYTRYRVCNVERIIQRAENRSGGGSDGAAVHPRVAHAILEDGSYCDDELMAEYYGGVLAASRTPSGRDDRAVSWSSAVASLSSIQIRAHYLLYREWASRLYGVDDLYLGYADARQRARMDIELAEFISVLTGDSGLDAAALLSNSIAGLARISLLDADYSYGIRDATNASDSEFESVLRVKPSVVGLELYGWAQGLPGITPYEFVSKALAFNTKDAIPRLTKVTLSLLEKPATPTAGN
jgi:hypothetical protein